MEKKNCCQIDKHCLSAWQVLEVHFRWKATFRLLAKVIIRLTLLPLELGVSF